jgi:hypothetical protein
MAIHCGCGCNQPVGLVVNVARKTWVRHVLLKAGVSALVQMKAYIPFFSPRISHTQYQSFIGDSVPVECMRIDCFDFFRLQRKLWRA